MKTIYKTPQIKSELARLTAETRAELPGESRSHTIQTRFGVTHVLEMGRRGRPRLLLLHGGATNSSIALKLMANLIEEFHIFAPDIPGHPGQSIEKFLDPRTTDFAHWLGEVTDKLDLKQMHILGISQGGIPAQRFMALYPERIEKAALYVPAGLVGPRLRPMLRKFLYPMQMMKLTGNPKYLAQLIENLFTTAPDKNSADFFALSLTGIRLDLRTLKLKTGEMKNMEAKTMIIGADADIVFPGESLMTRAREVYGPEVKTLLLKNTKHSLSPGDERLDDLLNRITDFLKGGTSV